MAKRLSPTLALVTNFLKLHLHVYKPNLIARNLSGSSDSSGENSESNSKETRPKLQRSFQLLGVDIHACTVEQIRKAYVDLVKQYHPNSRTPHASAGKFAEVCCDFYVASIKS